MPSNNNKPASQSLTVWAAGAVIAASIAPVVLDQLGTIDVGEPWNSALRVLTGMAGALAWYGRVRATKAIGSPDRVEMSGRSDNLR